MGNTLKNRINPNPIRSKKAVNLTTTGPAKRKYSADPVQPDAKLKSKSAQQNKSQVMELRETLDTYLHYTNFNIIIVNDKLPQEFCFSK